MEEEFPLASPLGVEFLVRGLSIGEATPQRLEAIATPPLMEDAAREFAALGVSLIVQCGTPLGFFKGDAFNREIIARLERATGLPATTMASSVVEALRHLGVARVVAVTPYIDELNGRLRAFLEAAGFLVLHIESVDASRADVDSYNAHPATVAYNLAKKVFADNPGAEGVLISCGGFRSIDMVKRLETELGVPVTTSNHATLWNSLRMLHIQDRVPGYGRLLRS